MSNQMKTTIVMSLALMMLLSTVCAASVDQVLTKDADDLITRGRYAAVPNALSRFLFYSSRPDQRLINNALGAKRSSSALDALTGVTLGKRSAPVALINLEPYMGVEGRRFGLRPWPQLESIEDLMN